MQEAEKSKKEKQEINETKNSSYFVPRVTFSRAKMSKNNNGAEAEVTRFRRREEAELSSHLLRSRRDFERYKRNKSGLKTCHGTCH